MVVEHLFPEQLLERKGWTAFVLAVIYSTIAIVIARLLFPANSGLVSVVFVSIFLIPYFETLLKRDEVEELNEKNPKFIHLLRDNATTIKVYFALFLGIYLTYMLYTFIAPSLGFDVGRVFREQLSLEGIRGGATFSIETFTQILLNNWWVLLACFLVSLIAGDGAIFFVAWNASAWGAIFGYRAFAAGSFDGGSAILAPLTIALITLPHLILEGGAYILAAISGGVISDEIVDYPEEVRRFVVYFLAAAILYGVTYFIVRMLFPGDSLFGGLLAIILALGTLYCMHWLFDDLRDKVVFRFNLYLFALAVGIFIVGAIVETFVLYNSGALQRVYFAAMMGG